MDLSTITLLGGLITCGIGIATFAIGMKSRAKEQGALEQKIDQAIKGIEEVKTEFKLVSSTQNSLALTVQSHKEQIKTLFEHYASLDNRYLGLGERLNSLDRTGETLAKLLERLMDNDD